MEKSEALAEKQAAVHVAQEALSKLMRSVCFLCEREEALFCEVVNGQHYHTTGHCRASVIRQLKTHVDDVRDQFANEFNEEQKPRADWSYTMVK